MNKILILILTILMAGVAGHGQTLTVSIDDHLAVPGLVSIPVEVTGFVNVGAISMFIEYDGTVLNFDSHIDGGIAGALTNSYPGGGGMVVGVSWSDENGVTFDGTFLTLVFNYTGGISPMDFLLGECEITDVDLTPLPVIYENGSVSPDLSMAVPIDLVDQLGLIPSALPGYIDVALDVDFSMYAPPAGAGIGSFNFEIEYDETLLMFLSLEAVDPSISSVMVNILSNPARVALIWNADLTPCVVDGVLLKLRFAYAGGTTTLEFLTGACEIADYNAEVLPAIYSDGIIEQDPATMPDIVIHSVEASAGDLVQVPVSVNGFSTIPDFGAFDYSIGFDGAVLQFQNLSFINGKLAAGLSYNVIPDELYLSWNSATPGITFDEDEVIFVMDFAYSGTDQLIFFKEENCNMDTWDLIPILGNYINGTITEIPGSNPTVCMETIAAQQLTEVLMPVNVTGFENIGAITLGIEFDQALVDYIGLEDFHPSLSDGASFYNAVDGQLYFTWNTSSPTGGITIEDGKLFDIRFFYKTGEANITFNHTVCEVANYDAEPVGIFYCDGLITGGTEVNLKFFLEGLYNTSSGQMNKAKDHDGTVAFDKFPGTVADLVDIEIHDASDYSMISHTVNDVEMNQDGSVHFNVVGPFMGNYYITVRTRNHLETVTTDPVLFNGSDIFYDFSDAAGKAYGSNMKILDSGVYGIFAGDIDQNGVINISDRSAVNSGIYNLWVGYLPVDLDGNGVINVSDRAKVNPNIYNLIEKKTPPN